MLIMTTSEVIEQLRSEGIEATLDQLRYAIDKGYINRPRTFGSSAMIFDGRNLRSVRSYFTKRKRGPGRPAKK